MISIGVVSTLNMGVMENTKRLNGNEYHSICHQKEIHPGKRDIGPSRTLCKNTAGIIISLSIRRYPL